MMLCNANFHALKRLIYGDCHATSSKATGSSIRRCTQLHVAKHRVSMVAWTSDHALTHCKKKPIQGLWRQASRLTMLQSTACRRRPRSSSSARLDCTQERITTKTSRRTRSAAITRLKGSSRQAIEMHKCQASYKTKKYKDVLQDQGRRKYNNQH